MRASRVRIATNQHGAETRITFGGFKTSRQPGQETLQDLFFLYANYAVIRAAHPNVSLICRAAWQYASVCRRHVRMRAKDGRYASIKVPA